MRDRHAAKFQGLRDSVLNSPGFLEPTVRAALAEGREVDDRLRSYADKIRLHAYKVVDTDIEDLSAAGYTEDQVFEATLSVALGAAITRLEIGLNALDMTRDP